jgi:hypothetical protein
MGNTGENKEGDKGTKGKKGDEEQFHFAFERDVTPVSQLLVSSEVARPCTALV